MLFCRVGRGLVAAIGHDFGDFGDRVPRNFQSDATPRKLGWSYWARDHKDREHFCKKRPGSSAGTILLRQVVAANSLSYCTTIVRFVLWVRVAEPEANVPVTVKI
jgi:hypothetical protein